MRFLPRVVFLTYVTLIKKFRTPTYLILPVRAPSDLRHRICALRTCDYVRNTFPRLSALGSPKAGLNYTHSSWQVDNPVPNIVPHLPLGIVVNYFELLET